MQFKSLQIQGFKSFADKTIIEFPVGITAIVGPNGSGKSNIMDALRWVFGEQRASELRGGNMDDVIFAGSEKRRPAGFAEVGLTMGDIPSDIAAKWGTFSEITVSRKIYRTGEREYYINGRKCRLKDIRDIFFDTGLGSKSISIIEQERVTKIINSTPEELRYFLEETAGVMRYKERRKEAETRLRQTRENLARIHDILSLIASDMERLEAQVSQLEKYRALRDKKAGFEKAFFSASYARILKDKEQQERQIADNRTRLATLVNENQKHINQETELKTELFALRDSISAHREDYENAKDKHAKLESDIRQLISDIENAASTKLQLQADIEAAEERQSELAGRMNIVSGNLAEVEEYSEEFSYQAEEHAAAIAEYKGALDRANDEKNKINHRYLTATQNLTNCINKINLKEAEINGHKSTIARLKREQESVDSDADSLQKRLDENKLALAKLEAEKTQLKTSSKAAFDAWKAKDDERLLIASQLADIDIKLKTTHNQIRFLKEEIAQKAVGGDGAALLQRFGGLPYINTEGLSALARLKYGDLIVFPDTHKAELLNALQSEDISISFVFDGDIGTLSPDGALISDNLYSNGVIYHKVGSDNAVVAMLALLDRLNSSERDAEEHKHAQAELALELETVQASVKKLYEEHEAQAELIQSLEVEHSTAAANVKHLEEQRQRLSRNMAIIEKEITLALDGIDIATDDLEQLANQKGACAAEQVSIQDEREVIDEKIEVLTEQLEDARESHAAAARELAKYTERKKALEAEELQLAKESSATSSRLATLNERIAEISAVSEIKWLKELDDAKATKEASATALILLSDTIASAESRGQEIEAELSDLRTLIDQSAKDMHDVELKLADILGKLESAENNLSALKEQVKAAFDADIDDVWQEYASSGAELSRQKITDEIAAVEAEIEALGALNMAAEDEYNSKRLQYNEQTAQQADIEEAVLTLSELIRDIDESTVKLFEETFLAVRSNFTAVFTRFFGSGSADLVLTEPENLLTTGVELFINPPGKRVSHKNLLSGGEKALGALTLLFALFLQKPTPFCFLDEVDAPLDDANVQRFNAMVKSMSAETQFIIITHKHQTMAGADSLYGVTMQEGGVSTMLSVELRD